MIALCAILLLAPQAHSQQIKAVKKKYTISGTIGLSGVSLAGLPGPTPGTSLMTDENGAYSIEVESGWTGTVTPRKTGYEFQPASRSYTTKVTANQPEQNYTASLLTFTISGMAGQPGVRMAGFPMEVISDQTGRYTATVDYGWSGIVTPDKMGFRFEPPSQTYNQVIKNTQHDYKAVEVTFTISGSAGVAGITMQGLPGNPVTAEGGRYTAEVRYGAQLKVVPTKEGHLFTPEFREYPMVIESQANQDYDVHILTYEISGSTGMPGVTLKGFPQDVVTNENGFYTVTVNHGWTGKVTPVKPGYTFVPDTRQYPKVTESIANHDYAGSVVYLKIEGNAGIGSATLSGFPQGVVTADEKGVYRTQVEYGWSGTVIPQKEGYFFTPTERPFNAVAADQIKQDFKAEKVYFDISGNVGLPGVTLKGFPGLVVSKPDGSYSVKVDFNWTGTVTPTRAGFTFDPTELQYAGVLAPQTNQDYTARTVQYAISGKVVDKTGSPIPDVTILADNQTESVITDLDGQFELKVDHGWKGKITPQKDGWIFTPATKPFDIMVTAPVSNQTITGEIKMLTISNVLKAGDEPIQGVQVSAEPGGYKAMTDARGKWSIKVPYGWTGKLSFFKEEFDFEGTVEYTNVTQDIDETAPAKPPTATTNAVQPPVTNTATTNTAQPPVANTATTNTAQRPVTNTTTTNTAQPPVTNTATTNTAQPPVTNTATTNTAQPPVTNATDAQPPATLPTAKDLLLRRLDQVNKQLQPLIEKAGSLNADDQSKMIALMREYNQILSQLGGGGGNAPLVGRPGQDSIVGGDPTPRLHSVLAELSRRSNTQIAVDKTVKDEPVVSGVASVEGLPLELALKEVLTGLSKSYTFRKNPDGTYLVYHPISNQFPPGSDLLISLQDIATEAEVSIMTDPNVSGAISVSFTDLPLEGALTRVLAGTPYVFMAVGDYYIIGDRSPSGPAFPDISVIRVLQLNHKAPQRVKELLPAVYQRYVQAEAASTTDPNDQGHTVTITAPTAISERIVDYIKKLDLSYRQVLLDARVVAMERGNLLNLGVEWQFPTAQWGGFKDDTTGWLTGLSLGYSPDQTFTNSLMAKLNMLESTSQADIVANPQLTAQDGSQAQLRSIQEEWFMMSDRASSSDVFGSIYSRSELQKIESGTVLTITPRVGDSNEITLEMAIEVSNSIPRGADSSLPIVTRRQTKNKVTVMNGGTVAVAGLTENRTQQTEKKVPILGSIPLIGRAFRNNDDQKATREIAVFVTATLIPETSAVPVNNNPKIGIASQTIGAQPQPAGQEFKAGIKEALGNRQPQ